VNVGVDAELAARAEIWHKESAADALDQARAAWREIAVIDFFPFSQ